MGEARPVWPLVNIENRGYNGGGLRVRSESDHVGAGSADFSIPVYIHRSIVCQHVLKVDNLLTRKSLLMLCAYCEGEVFEWVGVGFLVGYQVND